MRRKMTVQINAQTPRVLVVEPYAYEQNVVQGDVISMTYLPEAVGDTIEISDTHLIVYGYEAVLSANGTVALDLQVAEEPDSAIA